LLFENKILYNKTLFISKIKTVADYLKIPADWLMAVMWHESRLKATAVNTISCVGLIQFCPSTYINWGYNLLSIYLMPNVLQLDLVQKYYQPYRGKIKHPLDLFLITFYPWAFINGKLKHNNYVFGSEKSQHWAETIGKNNKGFDLNSNGVITMKEYIKYHNEYFKQIGLKKYRNISYVPIVLTGTALISSFLIIKNKNKIYKKLKK